VRLNKPSQHDGMFNKPPWSQGWRLKDIAAFMKLFPENRRQNYELVQIDW